MRLNSPIFFIAIPVDTHVSSPNLQPANSNSALVSTKMPEETEMELRKTIPKGKSNRAFCKFGL